MQPQPAFAEWHHSLIVLTTLDSDRALLLIEYLSCARTISSYFASVVTGSFGKDLLEVRRLASECLVSKPKIARLGFFRKPSREISNCLRVDLGLVPLLQNA